MIWRVAELNTVWRCVALHAVTSVTAQRIAAACAVRPYARACRARLCVVAPTRQRYMWQHLRLQPLPRNTSRQYYAACWRHVLPGR